MIAPGKNEKTAAKYRRLSPVYDWAARNRLFERPRARMFELAAIQPTDRVLVVGVGTGLDLSHMPDGADVTGIDPSPAMLARAEGRARAGVRGGLVRCCGHELHPHRGRGPAADARRGRPRPAAGRRPLDHEQVLRVHAGPHPSRVQLVHRLRGGASLTVSLIDAIGCTPLRVVDHETTVAVDIFRLEHA
jgi:hypothetical protein